MSHRGKSTVPDGSAPGQRYSPVRWMCSQPSGGARSFARPRRRHPPVEVGDQGSGPVRHGGFRSSGRGARCLRCFRQRPHWPAPRRPAGAGPSSRANRRSAKPVVRTGRSRRPEPTAAPFGCRRSGATAPARRRRRGTRGPQMEQHRRLPGGGDQGQLREQGQEVFAS